jgi:hypothetical protein
MYKPSGFFRWVVRKELGSAGVGWLRLLLIFLLPAT